MIRESYSKLTPFEKQQFVHKLHHIIMSDEEAFQGALMWLKWAEKKGLLDGIEIIPERPKAEDLFENIVLGKSLKS